MLYDVTNANKAWRLVNSKSRASGVQFDAQFSILS